MFKMVIYQWDKPCKDTVKRGFKKRRYWQGSNKLWRAWQWGVRGI